MRLKWRVVTKGVMRNRVFVSQQIRPEISSRIIRVNTINKISNPYSVDIEVPSSPHMQAVLHFAGIYANIRYDHPQHITCNGVTI